MIPMAASSDPRAWPWARASSVDPVAPRAMFPGTSVPEVRTRATSPPSWSMVMARGILGPLVRAASWRPSDRAATCPGSVGVVTLCAQLKYRTPPRWKVLTAWAGVRTPGPNTSSFLSA